MNGGRINHENITENQSVYELEPLLMINHKRFDIMAKYIYGVFLENNINSTWGYRLYEDHIWVFNNYDEDDNSGKKGIKSFFDSFNGILKSVKENGFIDDVSIIPINKDYVPIDGAHRLAAALLYNKKVKVTRLDNSLVNYNYEFFKRKGLLIKWSDAMAYEYCKLNKNTFVILLSPFAIKEIDLVKESLNKLGSIYYEKYIDLENNGPINLASQLNKLKNKLNIECPLNIIEGTFCVLLFEAKHCENISRIYGELIKIYEDEKNSFYINDNHAVTVQLAQLFLNENSLHYLNNAIPGMSEKLKSTIKHFKTYLNAEKNDAECFCVISDAVLDVYGIREFNELSFIQSHSNIKNFKVEDIKKYTEKNLILKIPIDDIIFNPENHFYYDGIKFCSLKTLKKIKRKQNLNIDNEGLKLAEHLVKKNINQNIVMYRYRITKELKIIKLKIIEQKLKYKRWFISIFKIRGGE
ncbi:hypothetical protein VBD025_13760 [Virgibacillus flavescens]|uniref:hypothetical protein n=1 Tax=Virgibacillus flavescens TaxID=1611422 RepID=UPI003D329F19